MNKVTVSCCLIPIVFTETGLYTFFIHKQNALKKYMIPSISPPTRNNSQDPQNWLTSHVKKGWQNICVCVCTVWMHASSIAQLSSQVQKQLAGLDCLSVPRVSLFLSLGHLLVDFHLGLVPLLGDFRVWHKIPWFLVTYRKLIVWR